MLLRCKMTERLLQSRTLMMELTRQMMSAQTEQINQLLKKQAWCAIERPSKEAIKQIDKHQISTQTETLAALLTAAQTSSALQPEFGNLDRTLGAESKQILQKLQNLHPIIAELPTRPTQDPVLTTGHTEGHIIHPTIMLEEVEVHFNHGATTLKDFLVLLSASSPDLGSARMVVHIGECLGETL